MVKKIILFFAFVLLFIVEKPMFMLYHWELYLAYPVEDWWAVVWHGLPHDLTVAGYFSALPFLVHLVYIWTRSYWHTRFMHIYLRVVLAFLLLVFFVDLELYTHWGFRLDATPLIYLTDNPIEAISQAPLWSLFVLPLLLLILWWALQKLFCMLFNERAPLGWHPLRPAQSLMVRLGKTLGCLFCCAVLFLPIRGSVTVSTMNVGRVYFSPDMKLNHAAINPVFSFLSSVTKHKDLSRQYRFMTDAEAAAAMDELAAMPAAARRDRHAAAADTAHTWLSTPRPNVVLILLESFSGTACAALTPEADPAIMPTVNRMYDEGIGFTQFYANSFRTDRGVAAVLAAYPGQPTHSIMKDATKTQNLQYLTARLADYGYTSEFIHGGDADFTNMRSFLMAGRVEHVVADADFPITDRLSKWGVPDHKTFDYLYETVATRAAAQAKAIAAGDTTGAANPFMEVFLTLSSHEPFDVPSARLADRYLNSVAYADSCLGSFVDRMKATPYWDNLLVIAMPDHCYSNYPAGIMTHEPQRYHIPMVWAGGAVAAPRRVTTIGSQTDFAATLLAQMGIDHADFNFSKDLASDTVPHYAFYAWPDGFGFLTDSISYIQDNANDGRALPGSDDPTGRAERWGKAYLQTLYDDLSRR